MRKKPPFSQIFLKDKHYIEKVVSALDSNRKVVLEIGSGAGQISKLIAKKAKFIYCVEIDSKLAQATRDKLSSMQNTEVIQADIQDVLLSEFSKKLLIFSNIPFHLSSKLIDYLIFYRKNIAASYLILQKDFVKKISASPKTKSYGFISCLTQYYAKVKHLFDIPAGAFNPIPKVDSSFIELKFYKKKPVTAENEEFLFKFIKTCFNQRRKKISTIIKQEFLPGSLNLLNEFRIDLSQRPEQISLEDFSKISDCLYDFNNS
ncbi:MAG: 16S rRNA (adenine(1518)-N(6)/adenine(1519)-N(6))-dimethyltransferase RsmA [Candidatus Omnitrophica bacterium]|nr:16S rRNA (adenine(1518)-N(6)/adenine(1519)-N(6))-dimethyltransferase RsmA [Candidatus Omnitrophota bacterium]MCF7893893.1 16S rRNA (adenine(1518)-N(6)/adenine(1519)-N(6))-dimethyltransferase RsmA [Candidatus Omnitrophota bacterium]